MPGSWVGSVYQDGVRVAAVYAGTREQAEKEVAHYAMMYSQNGPVKVVIRKPRTKRAAETRGEGP